MGLSASDIYELHQLLGVARFSLQRAKFEGCEDLLDTLTVFNTNQLALIDKATAIVERARRPGPTEDEN